MQHIQSSTSTQRHLFTPRRCLCARPWRTPGAAAHSAHTSDATVSMTINFRPHGNSSLRAQFTPPAFSAGTRSFQPALPLPRPCLSSMTHTIASPVPSGHLLLTPPPALSVLQPQLQSRVDHVPTAPPPETFHLLTMPMHAARSRFTMQWQQAGAAACACWACFGGEATNQQKRMWACCLVWAPLTSRVAQRLCNLDEPSRMSQAAIGLTPVPLLSV
jgi:hypothetical protein